MGQSSETVADAIFRAFYGVVDREGPAAARRRAGIASTTVDRWLECRRKGTKPGLNRANLEALCTIPEVRAAAASALLHRADDHATAWKSIAGELSRLMDPSTGWELTRKLRDMRELGFLDGGLSALDGMITARRRAQAEESRHDGSSARASKRKK